MSKVVPAPKQGRRAASASEGSALGRRFQPEHTEMPGAPGFGAPVAAAVYAIAALLLGYPALGGRFLVTPISDQYLAGYAFREYAASTLRSTGSFPLWNPFLQGGVPYVGGMAGDIFYPTFLLRLVMPVDLAMTWSFIGHVFLAGLFTFLFLRAAGLGSLSSTIGGLAYMMGGPIASYASPGHDGKLYVSALFPLMLFLLVRGVRDGRQWVWGLIALVTGLAVLSPHPQLLQYMLLGSGAFALYLTFIDGGASRLDRPVALKRLGLVAIALLVGGAVGAVQYLPVMEYVAWSPRSDSGMSRGWEHATQFSFPPEELVNTVIPQFSGMLEQYWGRNLIHLHSEYLGVVVLVMASVAFTRTVSSVRRSFLWFWFGAGVVGLLWSLGGFTPFYRLVYAVVPGSRFFRAPSTFFFIVAFSVAVLAAIGAEILQRGAFGRRFIVGWSVAGALLLLVGLSGGLVGLGTSVAGPERYDLVVANSKNVALGTLRSACFLAATLTLLLVHLRRRLSPLAAGSALAAIAVVDLWSIERRYWPFSPRASVLYASDAAVEFLKRQPQPGRVLALPLGEGVAYHDPFLEGDGLMVQRIRQVMGYHGNELARYQVLLGKDEGYSPILSATVWRLLNVQYLLTNVDTAAIAGLEPLVGRPRLLVGPVKNAGGTTTYLYGSARDNPYAWVAPAMVKAEDSAVLPVIRNPVFDPSRVALFDTAARVVAPSQLSSLPTPAAVPVTVTRYAPGRVALRLGAPAPPGSALVVSENYYPGWQATVNGKPAAVGRADFTLIGVALPSGAQTVELTFRSRPYEVGKAITLAALALATALALGGFVLDRRRRV